MKKNAYNEPMLLCPECRSDRVTVTHEQAFMANTGEHWCHSVKTHDNDSKACCLECSWYGFRLDLQEAKE